MAAVPPLSFQPPVSTAQVPSPDAQCKVVTPAVVKEGELAPYQELAYLTEPLPHELEYMAAQSQRFDDLTHRLTDPFFASRPFLDWIHQRAVERGSRQGAQVGWERFDFVFVAAEP